MNYLKKLLFCCTLFAFTAAALTAQEAKNALLIANGDYPKEIGELVNPKPEAQALRKALESIGFNVTLVQDADREEIDQALSAFEDKTKKGGGIAFFHYGGHAMQIDGTNYLIPAKTKVTAKNIQYRCVNVNEMIESIQGSTNIIILDSCRNNPFPSEHRGTATRGLAPVQGKSTGKSKTMIVYSASDGNVAQDGVFTPALIKYIVQKNKPFNEILLDVNEEVRKKTAGEQQEPQEPRVYAPIMPPIYLAGTPMNVTAGTGRINIFSEVAGDVYIDNAKKGEIKEDGELSIELPNGSCTIEMRSEMTTWKRTVKVDTDKTTHIRLETGNILLSSDIAGEVYINGRKYRENVREKIPISIKRLPAGKYTIEIRDGATSFKKEVLVIERHDEPVYIAKSSAAKVTAFKKEVFVTERHDEPVYSAKSNADEVTAKPQAESKEDPVSENQFYAPGLSIGYSFSHLTVSNIASFNAHGLDLKFEPARFAFGNFDMKIVYFVYSYSHAVIDSGNYEQTEKIDYHEFNFVPLKLGSNLDWFSFHAGIGLSLLWENAAHLNLTLYQSPEPKIGVVIPMDIGVNFTDFIGMYAEYKSVVIPIQSSEPFVKHSLNVGLSFYIPIYF